MCSCLYRNRSDGGDPEAGAMNLQSRMDRAVDEYLRTHPDELFVYPREIALLYMKRLNKKTLRPIGKIDYRAYTPHIRAAGYALKSRGWVQYSSGSRNHATFYHPARGGLIGVKV